MTNSPRKVSIKNSDMPEEVQNDAITLAQQSMERYTVEKDMAQFIKKEFDKKYNPTWHVIVGRSFGSFVTHESGHFVYFYINSIAFLIWKAGSGSS